MNTSAIGDRVRFTFQVRDTCGRLLQESARGAPLEVVLGAGELLPEVEQVLLRLAAGQHAVVALAETGELQRDERRVTTVSRANLIADFDVAPGQRVVVQDSGGEESTVTVVSVSDDAVVLDGNHPFCGMIMRVDVVDVQGAGPAPDGSRG